ncbi:type II toxin-antitoxin system RelE/ParE family toxin [Collinsella provencensis]|uniref:type II toxin-antitoxin system RelE/ParE family toxin n=1 Tax=Collinsella provencensis TaxID=1937461 RepID=UPI00131C346E|nr:hypothetical protein [Collinsella provencensis]
MTYRIRVVPALTERLGEITTYIRDDLGLPKSASMLYDDLEAKFAVIEEFPRAYMVDKDASRAIGEEIRGVSIRSFKLLYWIDDAEQTVLAFAILFRGEDPKALSKNTFLL